MSLKFTKGTLVGDTAVLSEETDSVTLKLPQSGGGLELWEVKNSAKRYCRFFLKVLEDHSQAFDFAVYAKGDEPGKPRFYVRFGVLPQIRTLISIDLDWLNADQTFPDHVEGALKFVCLGGRIEKDEIDRFELTSTPSHHELTVVLSHLELTDEKAEPYPLPDIKLIDEMGQLKTKEWEGKAPNVNEMARHLQENLSKARNQFAAEGWSSYGGWKKKKLTEGTGFFSKIKQDGKWWLVDPLGYAFFSIGPDVITVREKCRVDGWEKYMDWLPEKDDPVYKGMYGNEIYPSLHKGDYRIRTWFSFIGANLYRAFGSSWYENWMLLMSAALRQNGMNTIANWSDDNLKDFSKLPYVTTLRHFPTTKQFIFRDFPDVFSEEYEKNAEESAQCLEEKKDDPYQIGYFLRNEPLWAFADGLIIAEELLRGNEASASRDKLIETLQKKYESPERLSKAWRYEIKSFDDLRKPVHKASALSEEAYKDMREFSRLMMDAYISIPTKACRKVAPNHMNLGMRWAWITDPEIITGWEHFDVFSINCYKTDPKPFLDNVVALGVDRPILIGEFQFGALDGGQTATGLEAAASQVDRGKAYRYYCEQVAAHSHGVGCHWFQCYDQFPLGRVDGENYNIGLFDICSRPNEVLLKAVKQCGEGIYSIAAGEIAPTTERATYMPKISF